MHHACLTFCNNAARVNNGENPLMCQWYIFIATLLYNYSNNSSIHPNGESTHCVSYTARSGTSLGVRRGPYHLTCHVEKFEVGMV